ncbi:MAG: helix-turn-helix domain-containing protein [Nitrosomonadales bacterium]|nr:helix-turn-helix domain-containing protein [Nitrosomonadales bacterium]
MEQLPEINAGQGDDSDAMQVVSLGKMLREARERIGLSVADVANQIKFAPRQIEALEADDFRHLPEMTFVRGFVRSYAKILDMDAQPLLALLPQTNASQMPLIPISVEVPFPGAYSPNWHNLIWLGVTLLLAVLVVVFAVWHFTTPVAQPEAAQVETPISLPSKMEIIPASPVLEAGINVVPEAQPAPVEAQSSVLAVKPLVSGSRDALPTAGGRPEALPQTQPETKPDTLPQTATLRMALTANGRAGTLPQTQPAKPAAQPGTLPQTSELHFVFDEDSWVEIKDKDGKILSSRINPRGSELRLNGNEPFSLVISHAASVLLYHRGKQVDLTPYTRSSSEVARLTLE